MLFILLLSQSSGQNYAYITSSSTPGFLLTTLNSSLSSNSISYQLSLISFSSEIEDSFLASYSLLVDLTYSSILSTRLRRIASDNKVPVICWRNCPISNQNMIIQPYPSCKKISEAIKKTLKYLEWFDYALFYDDSQCSEEISTLSSPAAKYYVPANMPKLTKILISKQLKTSGIKQWVLITDYKTSNLIQQTLKESNMLKSGTGLLAGPYSYFGLSENGVLQLSNPGFEDTSTVENFLVSYLFKVFEEFSENNELQNFINKQEKRKGFSLFNIQNQGTAEIYSADCEENCDISQIIYIGNSTEKPLNTKTIIPFSLSAGITDPTNLNQTANQVLMNGAYVAVNYYNNVTTTLKNFEFQYKDIPCYTDANKFNSTCYDDYSSQLGLFHLSPHSEFYSIFMYNYIKEFNLNLFGTSDGLILSEKNNYPLYISTGVPYKYGVNALLQVIKFMGFDKFAIISPNSTNSIVWVGYAINDAPSLKMTILNNLNKYVFNVTAAGQVVGSDEVFQEIIDCRARIIIVAGQPIILNNVLKKFYDIGLEKGDIFIAARSIDTTILLNYTDPDFYKRKPFLQGMFSLKASNYLGEVGNYVKNKVLSEYGTINQRSCDYFDCFSLGYYGIESLIVQGKDYEIGTNVMAEARKARFPGCNGSIKVIDYKNIRESELYNISQVQYDGKNYSYVEIARYFPSGTTLFEIVKDPYWTDSGTPSELRTVSWSCPFRPSHLKSFKKGKIVVGTICGVIGLFTLISTVLIWKYFWNKEIDEIVEKAEMSFQDSVVMVTILIEFIQTAGMGPDVGKLASGFKTIASALTYSIDDFIELSDGVFWYVLLSILLSVGYWVLLCVVWIFKLHDKFYHFWLFRFFGWSILNLMPILGNLMFIPIISTLVNVFVCDKSLDGTYAESILDKDCYQKCWDSQHMPYAVISGIFILLYQPLAVYFRPMWQELLPLLHIKALPRYLMLKSVFQVVLIILNKTLKRFDQESHAIVFILLISCYLAAICVKNSYNYARTRLWHKLGTLGIIWLVMILIINEYAYKNQVLWICLLFAGWIIICVFGILIQRKNYPNLLFRQPQKDIEKIFRWMFNLERSDSAFKSQVYLENPDEQQSNDRMVLSS